MLMKKNSIFIYSYNSIHGKSSVKIKEITQKEKKLNKTLELIKVKAPEHVCKKIIDYAYSVCE